MCDEPRRAIPLSLIQGKALLRSMPYFLLALFVSDDQPGTLSGLDAFGGDIWVGGRPDETG